MQVLKIPKLCSCQYGYQSAGTNEPEKSPARLSNGMRDVFNVPLDRMANHALDPHTGDILGGLFLDEQLE